jgi:hypothetical protein
MRVDYDYLNNVHTLTGAEAAFAYLVGEFQPASVLDVGCGLGTWLCAARRAGIQDIFGVDGSEVRADQLLIPPELFRKHNLCESFSLGRRFNLVLCLEVAEHLEERFADTLICTLVRHSDVVVFSAAVPKQDGQNHVNCQWPEHWQSRFNAHGYVCSDAMRWKIWADNRIEWWYRQNIFVAQRDKRAGTERRIPPVLHPEFIMQSRFTLSRETVVAQICDGGMPTAWYLKVPFRAFVKKAARVFGMLK